MKKLTLPSITLLFSATLFAIPHLSVAAAINHSNTSPSKNYTVSDAWISTKIRFLLNADKMTKDNNITVNTTSGVVFLNGVADSQIQADKVIETAQSVDGVQDVDPSALTVKDSDQPMQDSYITAKIRGVFLREKMLHDSHFPMTNLNVETQNGVVYLRGRVPYQKQADRAIQLVGTIHGVTRIISSIKITSS